MSTTAFKCPCCGAELTFSSQSQKMTCEYCGTELDVEAVNALSSAEPSSTDMEWSDHSDTTVNMDGDICTYTCSSCGAEVTGDKSLGATYCPYCGNPFVMNDRFDGMLRPDYVIPFKVSKDQAVEKFKAFCKGRPLLPSDFINGNRIEKVEGMYVPYWLFDCDVDADYRFRGEKVTSWTEGDYDVTKTDHFLLIRGGKVGFEHVPVDGTTKLGSEITEAIEPFAMDAATGFNAAYLSGYLADRYDIPAEDCRERANQRIKVSTENAFMATTTDYSAVTVESANLRMKDGKTGYALMPMWLMSVKFGDKKYTFAMNGQTGRFVGELPVSPKRAVAMFVAVAAVSAVIIALILGMLGI